MRFGSKHTIELMNMGFPLRWLHSVHSSTDARNDIDASSKMLKSFQVTLSDIVFASFLS